MSSRPALPGETRGGASPGASASPVRSSMCRPPPGGGRRDGAPLGRLDSTTLLCGPEARHDERLTTAGMRRRLLAPRDGRRCQASPAEVAESLAYALRFDERGRPRPGGWEFAAGLAAERPVEQHAR